MVVPIEEDRPPSLHALERFELPEGRFGALFERSRTPSSNVPKQFQCERLPLAVVEARHPIRTLICGGDGTLLPRLPAAERNDGREDVAAGDARHCRPHDG